MRWTPRPRSRVPSSVEERRGVCAWVFLCFTLASPNALAIPAPDLVINLFASLAQLAGLAAAGFGALAMRFRLLRRSGQRGPAWLPGALIGLICLLLIGNLAQCTHSVSEHNLRLEANLWRKAADWDRSFDAPTISPEALAEKIARNAGLQIVDVREPEEFEVAHFAQAVNHRYADLMLEQAQLPSGAADVVFVCDSGKRSGEVCEKYRALGVACSVLDGGYPRWANEGRPLWLASSPWRARFRPLPAYPGDTLLLDTPAVTGLVASKKAAFLDVRSPAEFARSHLAGAINLPMRGMTTPALDKAIAGLDSKPYISVCYDNRSCFHAKVLGLKLQRLGHEVLGRYTLPHEYPIPARLGERSLAARAHAAFGRGVDRVATPLAQSLHWLARQVGSLTLVLLLLLLVTRLPFGPVATKAARDRQQQRADAEHLARLRAHHAGDEFRLQRALTRWRQSRHQTPWRNLGVSLLQLGLFALCFAAVGKAALWSSEPWIWIPQLSEPDPLGLLSWAVAGLSLAVLRNLRLGAGPAGAWSWVWQAGVSAVLGYATQTLPAAVVLYLAASLGLLSLQQHWRRLSMGLLRLLRSSERLRPLASKKRNLPVLAFEQAQDLSQMGAKALRLGQLARAGFAVPAGWVLPHDVQERLFANGGLNTALAQTIARHLARSKARLFAVRSSARCEDGAASSYAGVFETRLHVPHDQVLDAVRQVRDSYRRVDPLGGAAAGGVIIQAMVDAEYAGVLFTQAPGNAAAALIECVAGVGDALVGGSATPETFVYGRLTSQLYAAGDQTPPIAFDALLRLGQAIENLFGSPQDIEWAWRDGQFFLLQSRDITARLPVASPRDQAVATERERLMALVQPFAVGAGDVLFEQTDLSADLPEPTAASLSLMQRVRGEGGSTDRAMQALGMDFKAGHETPSEVQTVFGRTYVLRWPAWRCGQRIGAVPAFLLSRRATMIDADFEWRFLPAFLDDMRWRAAVDFERLSDRELLSTLAAWTTQFVTQHCVQAEIINIAADFYMQTATQALQKKGLQLAQVTQPHAAVFERVDISTHGHRCVHDWELAQPRFDEDPAAWQAWRRAVLHGAQPAQGPAHCLAQTSIASALVSRAQRYVALKEQAKHECLRSLRSLRRVLLAIDRRFGLNGRVFDLRLEEIADLAERTEALRALAQQRHEQRAHFADLTPAPVLRLSDIETLFNPAFGVSAGARSTASDTDGLQGAWVAGAESVTGTVRVLHDAADVRLLAQGDIAVMQLASPQWVAALPIAAGLVTAVGGQLAHLALLARERGLPAIFGAQGALQALRTGDIVTLHLDGRVQRRSTLGSS
jgi:rifampicin phosphotransferase